MHEVTLKFLKTLLSTKTPVYTRPDYERQSIRCSLSGEILVSRRTSGSPGERSNGRTVKGQKLKS